MCLLEGEHELALGVARLTGDWGYRDSHGRVFFLGRKDRQVKRLGHRINLDTVQQVGVACGCDLLVLYGFLSVEIKSCDVAFVVCDCPMLVILLSAFLYLTVWWGAMWLRSDWRSCWSRLSLTSLLTFLSALTERCWPSLCQQQEP